jgi:hypothetical protein
VPSAKCQVLRPFQIGQVATLDSLVLWMMFAMVQPSLPK